MLASCIWHFSWLSNLCIASLNCWDNSAPAQQCTHFIISLMTLKQANLLFSRSDLEEQIFYRKIKTTFEEIHIWSFERNIVEKSYKYTKPELPVYQLHFDSWRSKMQNSTLLFSCFHIGRSVLLCIISFIVSLIERKCDEELSTLGVGDVQFS